MRGFLWQGSNKAHGGHCLFAWDTVSLPKQNGGLGIRNLRAHNIAMLCRFAAKVLQASDVPCYTWFASQYCRNKLPLRPHNNDTAVWSCIKSCIPLIIHSTRCKLGSGTQTSFWIYDWLGLGRLRHAFPTLYSFARAVDCTVNAQFTNGHWNLLLHPNLSNTAVQELQFLLNNLAGIALVDTRNDQRLPSLDSSETTTAYFYGFLTFRGVS